MTAPVPPVPPPVMPDGRIMAILKEMLFWLRIMMEHALFLKLGLPCEEVERRKEAEKFQEMFKQLLEEAQALAMDPVPEKVLALAEESIKATMRLFAFKRKWLVMVITCKIGGFNFPLLIDHISREAQYFINKLKALIEGKMESVQDAIIIENVFWLRIMADHAKFIRSLLDQSERMFFMAADGFSDRFDQLFFQAKDLESMIKDKNIQEKVPTVFRFKEDAEAAAKNIRDFKMEARDLINACKVLSVINPLLADHVLREAEKFLDILEELNRRDIVPPPPPMDPPLPDGMGLGGHGSYGAGDTGFTNGNSGPSQNNGGYQSAFRRWPPVW